jgi:transcriptional regulator with XRE-family HTH domain
MKPREIVGYRMRQERVKLDMSQATLAEVMSGLLGTTWYPQTVGAAEQGQRAFAVEDLLALTRALRVNLEHLTTPPPGEPMDLGPNRFTDWDEQPEVSVEDRLIRDVEHATQALAEYVRSAPAATGRIRLRSRAKGQAVQPAKPRQAGGKK